MKKYIIIFIFFIFLSLIFLMVIILAPSMIWANIDMFSIFSLVLFIIVLIYGLINLENYVTCLVFIFLGFPSNINNFIPGFYLGISRELGAAIFPIFSHIEIFLIFGVIRFKLYKLSLPKFDFFLKMTFFFIFLSFFINSIFSASLFEFGLMLLGSYQIRLIILFYLIINTIEADWFLCTIKGLRISIVFLAIESVLYTLKIGGEQLNSGSLGVNTFGNILAAISLFFFTNYFKEKNKNHLFWSFFSLVMSIFTGTRMSIIALFIGLLLYRYPIFKWDLKKSFIVFSLLFLFLFLTPSKFNVFNLVTPNLISKVYNGASNNDFINVRTSENTSIITRLFLIKTSINMVIDKPILGIGAGKWNYFKKKYGFPINVLIDSHNGFLAMISQYGIIAGLLLIFYLLIQPSFVFIFFNKFSYLFNMGYISLVMFFAEFSNSGIFKIQVFSILVFTSILLTKEKNKLLEKFRRK